MVSATTYLLGGTAPTYSYTSSGNDITMTYTFTLDWDWTESSAIEYGVFADDDSAADSGSYDETSLTVQYENDLTYTGTLTATGGVQGSLSSGDWVQADEAITWGA